MPAFWQPGRDAHHPLGRGRDREGGGIQVHRDGGIRSGALGEQFFDAGQTVGAVQQRAAGVIANAADERLRRRIQADQRAARRQSFPVGGAEHRAAADRDHQARGCSQLAAERRLQRPECRLTILREDVRDGFPRPRHDQIVQINEAAAHPRGYLATDAGLARAHEAGEGDVGGCHDDAFVMLTSSAKRLTCYCRLTFHVLTSHTRTATPHHPSVGHPGGCDAGRRSAAVAP